MKILFYSPVFHPSIGGLENVVAMIAEGLTARGHQVKVVTTTPSFSSSDSFSYEVIRQPRAWKLIALVRWSDIFFHHNVSLKGIWPLFFVRRPWVIAHHGWYTRSDNTIGWQDRLKRFVIRFASNIAVSQAVANHLLVPCLVIPNPYRDDLFQVLPEVPRNRDLVFLGRLVSDKGCDLLLDALALLSVCGVKPNLTIIGGGPDEKLLKARTERLDIIDQVEFVGERIGKDLVHLLNQHKIMVIPSRWHEPFGIVALEGAGCGCSLIASDGGGLKAAVGPCGVTFPNEDINALASCIAGSIKQLKTINNQDHVKVKHLSQHNYLVVAQAYGEVLTKIFLKRDRSV